MKFNTIQVLIASTLALGTVSVAQEVSAAEQTTSIYRLYNKNTGEHFYTQSRTECQGPSKNVGFGSLKM